MLELPGYKIEKQIGKGGMAKVYLAIHEGLHRKVAIKVMAQHLSEETGFSDRFMREARIVANLSHQNIVTVYDVNVHNGHHYIAMEYLPGGVTLDQRIKAGITPEQGVEVIKQVASALGFAHGKGIVHRDVKPENIMFREDGSAVLTDFGIARSTDSATKMTSTGTVVGTPHYMSPEQAQGQEIGPYADIYSLGVVFYETLTGKVPYDADSTIAVIFKHITEPVPTLPESLAKYQPVLNLMLAKTKDDRYKSCAEIINDLSSLQMGGDVSKATMVNNATLINQTIQAKLSQQKTAVGIKSAPQQASADEPAKNKWLIPGIAAGVILAASAGGLVYYNQQQTLQAQQAEQERLQQEQLQAENEKLAQQKRAEQQATAQAEEKQKQDEANRLAQERNTTEKARLQAEIDRQKQEQANLKASKDAEKEKEQQERTQRINTLLTNAETSLLNSQLKSAYENFKAVLQIDRTNRNATDGINRVAGSYLTMATNAAQNNDFEKANQYVSSAITIAPTHSRLSETQSRIFELRNAYMNRQAAQQTAQQPSSQPAAPAAAAPAAEPEKKRRSFGGF
jgi:tRNA A-37 threonylcarbamoyl transferase component Bud32